jgi:Uma2 family endonuclease
MNALCLETSDAEVAVRFPREFPTDEGGFFEFCQANRDLRIERDSAGLIIVMPPVGLETSGRNAALTAQLYNWSKIDGTGRAFDATAGFRLPNGAIRNPNAAWVPLEKWNRLPEQTRRRFATVCPDFVIALRSESDRLPTLKDKMQEYSANGAKLGFLIDPIEGKVHAYRPDRTPEILQRPTSLSPEPEMPGLVLDLTDVW